MKPAYRYSLLLLLLSLALPSPLLAQQEAREAPPEVDPEAYNMVVSALKTVISVIEEVTFKHAGMEIGTRLRQMTSSLNKVTGAMPLTTDLTPVALSSKTPDVQDIQRQLEDLQKQVRSIQRELRATNQPALASRLDEVAIGLEDATLALARLPYSPPASIHTSVSLADASPWLRPTSTYAATSSGSDKDRDKHDYRDKWRRYDMDWQSFSGSFVGDFKKKWPYNESSLYRPISSIRYNRVEGFALGIGLQPLRWDNYRRAKIYGQGGYAFSLKRWYYEIGGEARLSEHGNKNFDIKLGASYRRNTTTGDLWKSSWMENNLSAFFFNYDFFDYYSVEGWTVYTVMRFSPFIQFSLGYRSEDNSTLNVNTTWSLFGGSNFRINPPINDGRMNSVVLALEGGRIRGLKFLPHGIAFRAEADLGNRFGGDFNFNRYLGDVRGFYRLNRFSSLGLRLRGGLTTGEVPLQKEFTLGGIGSVRAYPQNAFYGSRMLLANLEYNIYDRKMLDGIIDDLMFFGFFDAGWVNTPSSNKFEFSDVLPSAGFGISLAERHLRLELAWPLRDVGGGQKPSLWLRLNPTF